MLYKIACPQRRIHLQPRSYPVAVFPNQRSLTKNEEEIETLKTLNTFSQIISDGIGTFVLIFCGLNWITYRRMNNKHDDINTKDKK